ncbi:MAG: glycosyltransferase [Nitrososphaeria archaeon]
MRALNIAFFISPFILAAALTWLTLADPLLAWLNYGVWLTMIIGVYSFVNFTSTAARARGYARSYVGAAPDLRVAAFVTAFNEDPSIVEGTLISVKSALGAKGDVFLLDDSTDPGVAGELRRFSEANGVVYLHREDRRGFKAGAINDALRKHGDRYDLVAIFDADQRPRAGFFDAALPLFSDPSVAFVQVPQNYTEIASPIAMGSKYQQEPFLRTMMRGRSGTSAFSLGSGTIFRIAALREVGLMDESSITEDAATSVRLHSRGWRSIYYDDFLVWYGEPPRDAAAYIQQQSRWALGYFQLMGGILRSDLHFTAFFDYVSGAFYWLKEGPLTLIEIIAPIIFLSLRQPFMKVDPVVYALAYFPYFALSIGIFYLVMRGKNYGLKGFFLHQSLEYLAFTGITAAFISYLLRRRVPFKVTPKGRGRRSLRSVMPHIIVAAALAVSIALGALWLMLVRGALEYAIAINIFWAAWPLPFLLSATWFALRVPRESGDSGYVAPAPGP